MDFLFYIFLAFHHFCLGDEQAAECIRNSKLSSFYLYLSQVTVAELKDHMWRSVSCRLAAT